MADSFLSFAVLLALAVGTMLTGRAVTVLGKIRFLAKPTPENFIACAFLGMAVWILTFGLCSHLGVSALPAALIVLALSTFLVVLGAARRPFTRLPKRRWARLALVALPCALGAGAVLLPVLVADYFPFYCDMILYNVGADWLKGTVSAKPALT